MSINQDSGEQGGRPPPTDFPNAVKKTERLSLCGKGPMKERLSQHGKGTLKIKTLQRYRKTAIERLTVHTCSLVKIYILTCRLKAK